MKSITKATLSPTDAKKLVEKHFPKETATASEELTEGMFNAAFLVTGTGVLENGVVLKLGPSVGTPVLTYEQDILSAEVQVYGMLQDKPIPIPKVLLCDTSRRDAPCDYFIMERIPGITWSSCIDRIVPKARPKLMEQLGQYNAAVHSVTDDWFGYIKEDRRFRFDCWADAFTAMIGDILNDGRARNNRLPYDAITTAVASHKACLNAVTVPSLVDYDMWAGNVFLDSETRSSITGVVDFERSFFGDRFADFTSAIQLFDDVEQEPAFITGYETVSGSPLVITEDDRLRMDLYRLYMAIIMHVETYRYEETEAASRRAYCLEEIHRLLKRL